MSLHSEFSPSQLPRILKCPGSVTLCREVPKPPTTSYAAEGTLLHSYMEQILNAWPEPVEIDYESVDHQIAIADCLDYVQQHIDLSKPLIMRVEEQVSMAGNLSEVRGTLDLGIIVPGQVHIFDWKFGRGVEVHASENYQLMAYLSGFLLKMTEVGFLPKDENYKMFIHVVQPRIDNYQWDEITIEQLNDFLVKTSTAVTLAQSPNPPFTPGPSQCKWCAAAAVCKARISYTQMALEELYKDVADIESNVASIEEILPFMDKAADIKQMIKQVEQFIFLELAKGEKVPGWKLVRGKSNRTWDNNVTIDTISDRFPQLDLEELTEMKMRSPAQVEKLIPKKDRELLAEYIVKPEGKLALAPENSPKPAVEPRSWSPEEIYAGIIDGDAGE